MALVKYFRIGWLAGRKHTHTNTSILQSTAITGRNIVRVRLVSQISGYENGWFVGKGNL